jgi:hypothetical protein
VKLMAYIFFAVLALGAAVPTQVWSAPEIAFSPAKVDFGSLALGSQDSTALYIKNVGEDTLSIFGSRLARPGISAFEVTVTPSELGAGDSVRAVVRFRPTRAGNLTDVVLFATNLQLDSQAQRPVLQISGEGFGAEIDVNSEQMFLSSNGLGVASTGSLSVYNEGNDTLRVSRVFVNDVRFAVSANPFVLAPGGEKVVQVTYTPDSVRSRMDTLRIQSNAYNGETLLVVMEGQETPQQVGAARMSFTRTGSAYPQVGDTLSVLLTVSPNASSIAGIELYFSYDSNLLEPANFGDPFTRLGYTESRLNLRSNEIIQRSGDVSVAHLSALAGAADSITASGLLAQIDLIVKSPLTKTLRMRVLVEAPRYNSQYITPAGLAFSLPASNDITLGNTPPVIRAFPPLTMLEDGSASLALSSLASDAESPPSALRWVFYDPDSLVIVSLSTPDSTLGAIARFFAPENESGVYVVKAVVFDPAGASDSSVVVLDVEAVNDAPRQPVVSSPGNNATGLSAPVKLEWSASDPDRHDVLTYGLRFGQNRLFLVLVAEGLVDPIYTLSEDLVSDADYYWQVVAVDGSGVQTNSPVWQFTTAADQVAPVFLEGPGISAITDSTASVSWSLDEPASARILLGLKADLSDSSTFAPIVLTVQSQQQTQIIVGLSPATPYFLQIAVADIAGNRKQSDILSLTTTGEAPIPPPVLDMGDFTGDRRVGFSDFLIFAAVFGRILGEIQYISNADFNRDGSINFTDFIVFAGVYGRNYVAGKTGN